MQPIKLYLILTDESYIEEYEQSKFLTMSKYCIEDYIIKPELLRENLASIENIDDKLVYLIDCRSVWQRHLIGEDQDITNYYLAYIDIEKENLESHKRLKDGAYITLSNRKQLFKLSDKKGAKIDLIRILNAIYELLLIYKANGQIPTKQEFMSEFGNFLGADLSAYHSNLSQALTNQPLEVNLKVFEEMKRITQDAHFETKK